MSGTKWDKEYKLAREGLVLGWQDEMSLIKSRLEKAVDDGDFREFIEQFHSAILLPPEIMEQSMPDEWEAIFESGDVIEAFLKRVMGLKVEFDRTWKCVKKGGN